jgi:hypothetical protein
MSIVAKPATPAVTRPTRGRRPLQLGAALRPGRSLVKIGGLVLLTSAAAALAAAIAGLTLVMIVANLGG